MRVASVVGVRPQFVKSAPVSRALRAAGCEEYLIHTGQHYDADMSDVFFDQMALRQPDINLGVGSASPGRQTGLMLLGLEAAFANCRPDYVLVYGDTNSTLAAALAAHKLGIPLAHVEAGLRSFNWAMPEEYNRTLTDLISDLLFCPTQTAVGNLATEGITEGVYLTGDVMVDAIEMFSAGLAVHDEAYVLATIHRPYNTDDPAALGRILRALDDLSLPVIFPVHPRTRKKLDALGVPFRNVLLTDPVGYVDMLLLERNARVIVTDSGGVQKEACILGVPCVTVRPETEWVETLAGGWNVLVGSDPDRIVQEVKRRVDWRGGRVKRGGIFGDGHAAEKLVRILTGATRSYREGRL